MSSVYSSVEGSVHFENLESDSMWKTTAVAENWGMGRREESEAVNRGFTVDQLH